MLDKSFVHRNGHTMIGISDDRSGNLMDVTAKSEADRKTLRFAMNLSLAVGLLMFVMKTGAYLLTGSSATERRSGVRDARGGSLLRRL